MRTLDIQHKGQQKMNVISLENSFSLKPSFTAVGRTIMQVHQYRQ